MQVFVTGATGFIGTHVVAELVAAGHQVLGMTRSDAGARALAAAGAQVHFGDLADLSTLRQGAAKADAVIHTAFDHDFSRLAENCEQDRKVIAALGDELNASGRPLIVTSGVGMGAGSKGELALETRFNPEHRNPRIASELAANALLDRGVDVRVVRLPQVHDKRKQGLISYLIAISRDQGVAAYLGEGQNRWSAVHVDDAASVYRLALELGQTGARYHAVAEEGVASKLIAEAVATGLGVPTRSINPQEVEGMFGWFGMFAGMDMAASGQLTRQWLGWQPQGPGLMEDLANMDYAAARHG